MLFSCHDSLNIFWNFVKHTEVGHVGIFFFLNKNSRLMNLNQNNNSRLTLFCHILMPKTWSN